jgi:Fe-S-cluster-containing dehydrogenase component
MFKASSEKRWAMIIDLSRCTGCQSCSIACKLQNHTVQNHFNTRIREYETGHYPDARMVFTPVQCNQCDDPPCLPACPEKAISKLGNGIVVTDWNICNGQGHCIEACPYEARFLDERFGGKADKCDFCLSRLNKGLVPACVEACASKARIWGDAKSPCGEFAAYLSHTGLVSIKSESGIKTNVLYKNLFQEPA